MDSSILNNIFSAGSGFLGVANSAANNMEVNGKSSYQTMIDDYRYTPYGYGDFNSLMNSSLMNISPRRVRFKDLGQSTGEKFQNTMNATIQGGMAGSAVGMPWLGAGIGAAAGIGSWIIGDRKVKDDVDELNAKLKSAISDNAFSFNYNAKKISDNMFNSAAMNFMSDGGSLYDKAMISKHFNNGHISTRKKKYIGNLFAYGGQMKLGGDWTNGVTYINEGGTHESNPYDGVMMGVDEQGIPNLVEEGEVVFNDYVYSKRLKPTKSQLEEVKLNKNYFGDSFADIAKDIARESEERPNDPISKNGLIDGMMKLMVIQEQTRAKKEESNANKFDDGGELSDEDKTIVDDVIKKLFGSFERPELKDVKIDDTNAYVDDVIKKLFGSFERPELKDVKIDDTNAYVDDVIKKLFDSFERPELKDVKIDDPKRSNILDRLTDAFRYDQTKTTPIEEEWIDDTPIKASKYIGAKDNLLRYAPAIGSGMQYLLDIFGDNREQYHNADMISRARRNIRNVGASQLNNYISYNPFDVNYEQNRLQNLRLGTQRNILNSSSGNRAAAMAALLSNNVLAAGNMGDLYRSALDYNNQQRLNAATFNRETDSTNASLALSADAANQRADLSRAQLAYNDALFRDNLETTMSGVRSANRNNFFTNMGKVGLDNYYNQQMDWYLRNVLPQNEATNSYFRKNGGRIRKKSKRLI